uniref:Uncharacterized protein n=1 Tax=Strongyloides venezuelensis TaxID=75913 RepID=A0A0K0G4H0_STRVS
MSKQCGSTVSTAITHKSLNTTAKRSINKAPLPAKNVGSHELLCSQTKTTTPNTQKLMKGIKRPRKGFVSQPKKMRVFSDTTKIYVSPVIKVSDDLKKALQKANKNNGKDKHSYPLLNLSDTKYLLTDESDDERDRESIMNVNKKASIVSDVPPDPNTIEIRENNEGFKIDSFAVDNNTLKAIVVLSINAEETIRRFGKESIPHQKGSKEKYKNL